VTIWYPWHNILLNWQWQFSTHDIGLVNFQFDSKWKKYPTWQWKMLLIGKLAYRSCSVSVFWHHNIRCQTLYSTQQKFGFKTAILLSETSYTCNKSSIWYVCRHHLKSFKSTHSAKNHIRFFSCLQLLAFRCIFTNLKEVIFHQSENKKIFELRTPRSNFHFLGKY